MGLAGEVLAAELRCVDDERLIAVVPVGRLLPLGVAVDLHGLAGSVGIEIEREGILRHPSLESRTGPGRSLEQGRFVIAGPGVATGARMTDVAGEHERQVGGAIHLRGMEPVIDPLSLVNPDRFHSGDVVRQLFDERSRRMSDLGHRLQVVVLQVCLIQGPECGHLDRAAVDCFHAERPLQARVDAPCPKTPADVIARDGARAAGRSIPDDVVAQLRMLLRFKPLDPHRWSVRGEGASVVGKDLVSPQALERVGADQERKIGELQDEVFIVPALLDHHSRDAEPERRIGLRPNRDPVVGLGRRGAVFRRDHHDLPATFHTFDEPVGIGQLVLDQVLAVHDDQLRKTQVVEVAIGGLKAMHPGVAGSLIAVPGIVGPISPGEGLVGADAPDLRVEQRQRIVESVHPVLADDPEQSHAAAHLDTAGPCAAGLFHHLRLVSLVEQPPRSLGSAVAPGDRLERPRDRVENVGP